VQAGYGPVISILKLSILVLAGYGPVVSAL